jgi:hypothetical protein
VDFYFMRAGKSIVAASAFALLTSAVSVPVAMAQDTNQQQQQSAGGQQPAAGGQQGAAGGQQPAAGQKNYKDRAEYDLYAKITQTADPAARLQLLKQWDDKYPQTDYAQERLQYYVVTLSALAAKDPAQRQTLIQKAGDLLKLDPKNFQALYAIAFYGPGVGGQNPPPDLVTQVDSAAHGVIDGAEDVFSAAKKPASVSDADFQKIKSQALAIAHNALAWEATTKKDNATAQTEYTASLQANPEQANISAVLGKMLVTDKKYPEGLFQYARAAQYDGPGALPAATRQQLLDYFNKAYKDFHGSDEGKQQLLDQAKTSAVPSGDLHITNASELANKQAEEMNKRIESDPGFKVWYAVKQNLQDKGDAFFTSSVKDFELPGEAVPSKNFTGTVISVDPTKVTLGVEDPTKPDATLEFSQPLPASANDKVKVGEKLDFAGIADSYTKDPYMLTFKDPTIPGVQTTAPARKGRRR